MKNACNHPYKPYTKTYEVFKRMITFLRKLFIKNYQDVNDEKVRASHGRLAAIFGIISNCILVAMKLTMAFIVAASSTPWVLPMALVGDAINNLSDMASSLVTLIGFKISAKPADKEHPFGHERIEYIAGPRRFDHRHRLGY
jgi:predicted membrane chloride channel (bestrophin family)